MDSLLVIFRALADPSRVRILLLVRRMELSVGEITAVLGQRPAMAFARVNDPFRRVASGLQRFLEDWEKVKAQMAAKKG